MRGGCIWHNIGCWENPRRESFGLECVDKQPAVKGILFGVCCVAALYSNCPSSRPLCPLRVLNNRFQSLVSSITLGRVDLNGCSRGRHEPTADLTQDSGAVVVELFSKKRNWICRRYDFENHLIAFHSSFDEIGRNVRGEATSMGN
jgi:hypothetical protein